MDVSVRRLPSNSFFSTPSPCLGFFQTFLSEDVHFFFAECCLDRDWVIPISIPALSDPPFLNIFVKLSIARLPRFPFFFCILIPLSPNPRHPLWLPSSLKRERFNAHAIRITPPVEAPTPLSFPPFLLILILPVCICSFGTPDG